MTTFLTARIDTDAQFCLADLRHLVHQTQGWPDTAAVEIVSSGSDTITVERETIPPRQHPADRVAPQLESPAL